MWCRRDAIRSVVLGGALGVLCTTTATGAMTVADARWVDAAVVAAPVASARWASAASASATVAGLAELGSSASLSNRGPNTKGQVSGSGSVTDAAIDYSSASSSAQAALRSASASASVGSVTVKPTEYLGAALAVSSTTGSISAAALCRVGEPSSGTLTDLSTLRVQVGSTTRSPTVSQDVASFAAISLNLGLASVRIGPKITRTATATSDPIGPSVERALVLHPGIEISLLGADIELTTAITLIGATCSLVVP